MEEGTIKSFVPHICPHCNQDIMIEVKMTAPEINTILRNEDINNAKESVIKAVDGAENMSVEEKQKAIDWIKNPDILFGPGDVEEVISGIVK